MRVNECTYLGPGVQLRAVDNPMSGPFNGRIETALTIRSTPVAYPAPVAVG